MNSENSILGNQLVVMSRADLDALVEKMASNLIAMRVEGKSTHGNSFCPVVDEEYPFDTIREMYGKPIGNIEQLRQRWLQLSLDEKKKIFEHVPKYVMARPDSKYRKDYANFLTYRTWETEPLTSNTLHNGSINQYCTPSNGTRQEVAMQNTQQLVSQFLSGSNEPAVSFGEGEG